MSSTNPGPTAAPSASSSSSNRPPVTLTSTTHLDPGAYIRGTHPITFGEHNLVHPRVLLTTTTHPITFGTNNIISEKAIIGGAPTSTTTSSSTANPTSISSPDPTTTPSLSQPPTPLLPSLSSPNPSTSQFTSPTTLHSYIHIHPSAQVSHSATVHNYTVIESHAVIHPGITVGAHSKICANVSVTRDVPEWTVVYGDGNARRSRRPVVRTTGADEGEGEQEQAAALLWKRIQEAEMIRVKNTDREREGTSIMLRNAARAAVAAKRQSMQR